MGSELNDEGELDDQKAENIKDEKDDDIRENEDDTIRDEIDGNEDNSEELSDSIWDEIDWSEDNSKEQSDSIWDEIDWSDDNSDEKEDSIWDEINWNEDEVGEKEINERENLDDELDAEKNNSNEQQEERDEEELHENLSSQSTSTVLVNENKEEMQEVDHDQVNETTTENMSPEEFEYLWDTRDKLDRADKTDREIEEVMHEAEEMFKTLKNAEKLYEEQQQEKLKLVDHEGEASEEGQKEDLDRVDLIEQVVDLEENLAEQGKLQEEIDRKVEEAIEDAIETTDSEKLENKIEKERAELIENEDEESLEELKEDLDRVDIIEKVVDLEENLVQQGESQEEIDLRVEEVIETTKFEEQSEILAKKERKESIDRKNEASEEGQKEDLDRVDLIENSVDLEEELVRQGKLQEEIDIRVEEAIEKSFEEFEFDESIEKLYKEQERKKLKLKDLEDEEIIGNLKEDLARVELIEHSSNKEEMLLQEEKSQEEIVISERSEEIISKLDAIEGESEDKKDLLTESIKIESEEADEEEDNHLQEVYRQEMGKRPIYAKKKTKGYIQWLEQQQELGDEKIRKSHTETETKKEIEDEDWKKTLKKWINEASEDECGAELKSELKKALERYNNFEDLTRKFFELYKKSQSEKLSEKEKSRMVYLLEKLQVFDPIQLELLANVRAIKKYIIEQYAWDSMNRFRDYRIRNKFFKHISKKYENLKQQMLKLAELINSDTQKILMNPRSSELSKYSQEEIEFFNKHGINAANFKYKWDWLREDLLVPFFLNVLYKKENKVPTSRNLQNWGYNRFIIILREKYDLTFSDLVGMAGKTPNVNIKRKKNFTTEERNFLIKNKIKPEKLTTRWEWMDLFPELMKEFFNEVLYSIKSRVPTSRELKKRGYSQFIEKLRNNGKTLGDLVKECGYTPRSSHHHNISTDDISSQELFFLQNNNIKLSDLTSKWSWMKDYPHLIVPFFKNVLLPFFGHVPTWNEIANTKFYGFIQKLSSFNLTYPEVILKAKYVPNYQILNESQKKKLYKSTEFLVNKYLETGSKPPSLLKLANLNLFKISDSTFGKYAKKYLINIYGDEYGNQLYSEMWINKTVGISDNIIKRINFVVENSSNKFIRSNERPIPIKDTVEYIIPEISLHTFTKYAKRFLIKKYGKQRGNKIYAEMWPNNNLATKVGSRLHVLINDLLTKFFDKKYIRYFSEPYIFPGRRPDGALIITKELKMLLKKNTNFLEKLNLSYKDFENFKAIVLDFTSDISDLNCKKKILKYQHPEILLLIIGTSWYFKKPFKIINGLNHDINNIRIIDIDILTKIIGLSPSLKVQLKDYLKHAKNYSIDSLNRIKTLDKNQLHNTESLKQLLINKGFIKEWIQEYLDFGLINHKVKTLLTPEDRFSIWNKHLLKNKIAIIDIETTGFNRHLDSILEIGIVELDTKTGKMKTLFNSLVRDSNFDISRHLDNNFVKNSGIDVTEIINSISIKECEKDLQLIFDNYKCTAYNSPFDFGWLESRGFSIPMKLLDVMRFCRKNFPSCGNFKFQEIYRYVTNLLKKSNIQYLTRSEYITNHRAIDDAICEAELLFYLIQQLGFVLSYQSKIFSLEE